MKLTSQRTKYVVVVNNIHSTVPVYWMFEYTPDFDERLSLSNKAFEENIRRWQKQESENRIKVLRVNSAELSNILQNSLEASTTSPVFMDADDNEWNLLMEKYFWPSADIISFVGKAYLAVSDSLHIYELAPVDLMATSLTDKDGVITIAEIY